MVLYLTAIEGTSMVPAVSGTYIHIPHDTHGVLQLLEAKTYVTASQRRYVVTTGANTHGSFVGTPRCATRLQQSYVERCCITNVQD